VKEKGTVARKLTGTDLRAGRDGKGARMAVTAGICATAGGGRR